MALVCFWLLSQGEYWMSLAGAFVLVFTAIWDCCDGEIARLKFMESDYGDAIDLAVDNIINLAAFMGIAWAYSRVAGGTLAVPVIPV